MSNQEQGTLFDERFLGKYAGAIMSDPTTALVELVANSWDAYATEVEIQWPDKSTDTVFRITDNGHGMTSEEFELRWRTLDYDRLSHQGAVVSPPESADTEKKRRVYGQNGKGRHAAFHFSEPYEVRTWKRGEEVTYKVAKGRKNPIKITLLSSRDGVAGHGCEIYGTYPVDSNMSPDEARSILSTRFLTDPDFKVSVNGVLVHFGDIPTECQQEISLKVDNKDSVKVIVIDSKKADKTTKQHGIAWWVNNRLVGNCGWSSSDHLKVIDGRSEEAKRYTFIVIANHLSSAVLADWSGFVSDNLEWLSTQEAVQVAVKEFIFGVTKEKRQKSRNSLKAAHKEQYRKMSVISRDRWNSLLDQMIDKCPNLNEDQMGQVLTLLANMELAETQYSLLDKIHTLKPHEIDDWDSLLESWSLSTAKVALDEIETRLKLIEEIRYKSSDTDADELHELQPLFERGLWIFGPEFEACDFTSNRTMATVIKKKFKRNVKGSANRPDFVITVDDSVGFYSRPSFDADFNENGVEAVVIVELKRAGVPIGRKEIDQAAKYVDELLETGAITENTKVHSFILGNSIQRNANRPRKEGEFITFQPMLYSTFTGQAEKRMLNLHRKLSEAPFLRETIERLEIVAEDVDQSELELSVASE